MWATRKVFGSHAIVDSHVIKIDYHPRWLLLSGPIGIDISQKQRRLIVFQLLLRNSAKMRSCRDVFDFFARLPQKKAKSLCLSHGFVASRLPPQSSKKPGMVMNNRSGREWCIWEHSEKTSTQTSHKKYIRVCNVPACMLSFDRIHVMATAKNVLHTLHSLWITFLMRFHCACAWFLALTLDCKIYLNRKISKKWLSSEKFKHLLIFCNLGSLGTKFKIFPSLFHFKLEVVAQRFV